MIHNLINAEVRLWFGREDCPVRDLVGYIERVGFLRDAQIEAIKTYLFLKIVGANRPLWRVISDGLLARNEDLTSLRMSEKARSTLATNRSARALFEFTRAKTGNGGNGKTLMPELENHLLDRAPDLDCDQILKRLFYGGEYPDYLFSLPMGAGKTYLMAAFIYLDL